MPPRPLVLSAMVLATVLGLALWGWLVGPQCRGEPVVACLSETAAAGIGRRTKPFDVEQVGRHLAWAGRDDLALGLVDPLRAEGHALEADTILVELAKAASVRRARATDWGAGSLAPVEALEGAGVSPRGVFGAYRDVARWHLKVQRHSSLCPLGGPGPNDATSRGAREALAAECSATIRMRSARRSG